MEEQIGMPGNMPLCLLKLLACTSWSSFQCGSEGLQLSLCSWQGLVLDCSPLGWEPLDEFPAANTVAPNDGGRPPLWLALDEIGDPVGACPMAMQALKNTAFDFPGRLLVSVSCPVALSSTRTSHGCVNLMMPFKHTVLFKSWYTILNTVLVQLTTGYQHAIRTASVKHMKVPSMAM